MCCREGKDKKLTSTFLGYSVTQAVTEDVMYKPAFFLITTSRAMDKKFLSPVIFQFRVVVYMNWENVR